MVLESLALNRLGLEVNHTHPYFHQVCKTLEQEPAEIHIHHDSPQVLDRRIQQGLGESHIHPHALLGPGVIHTHQYFQARDSWDLVFDSLAGSQVCGSWA